MNAKSLKLVGITVSLISLLGCSHNPGMRAPSSALSKRTVSYAIDLDKVDANFAATATPDERNAIDAIMNYLGPKINVVRSPFLLFHYAPLTQIGSPTKVKLHDPAGSTYVASKTERFFLDSASGNINGNGIYFAADPVSTISYGRNSNGRAFFLIVHTVENGTRILDTRNFDLNAVGRTVLSKVGCSSYSSFSSAVTNHQCSKYLKLAMKSLGISLVEYGYNPMLECEQRQTAFVLIDSDKVKDSTVSILTTTADLEDRATRELSDKVYALSQNQISEFSRTGGPQGLTQAETDKLRNESFLSCPDTKTHFSPLFGFSTQELDALMANVQPYLDVTNTMTGVAAVYSGKPLIQIEGVYRKNPSDEKNLTKDDSLTRSIQDICNGTTNCNHDFTYQMGALDPAVKSNEDLGEVRWNCVPNPVDLKTLEMDFGSERLAKISCDKDYKPASGKKKKKRK